MSHFDGLEVRVVRPTGSVDEHRGEHTNGWHGLIPTLMSLVLVCPSCGPREVTDFAFGGEVTSRPTERPADRELFRYIYFRRNVAGAQREWWYHRSGCRTWFLAERDTRTNRVLWTASPADRRDIEGLVVE